MERYKICVAVFIRFLHKNNERERWASLEISDLIYDVIRTEIFEKIYFSFCFIVSVNIVWKDAAL